MEIELLKKYKLIKKELPIGSQLGVTNELGQKLVDKKIAKDVTKQVKKKQQKERDEDTTDLEKVIEQEIDKAKKVEVVAQAQNIKKEIRKKQ